MKYHDLPWWKDAVETWMKALDNVAYPRGVVMLEPGGHILWANKKFLKITGYKSLEGKHITTLTKPPYFAYDAEHERFSDVLFEKGYVQPLIRDVYGPNGETKYILGCAFGIKKKSGKPVGVIIEIEDFDCAMVMTAPVQRILEQVTALNKVLMQLANPILKTLPVTLTPTELRLIPLFRLGMSAREIADRECVSQKTIENHRSSIRKKLKVPHGGSLIDVLQTYYT